MALNRRLLIGGIAVMVIAVVGAAAVWHFAVQSNAPSRVSLEGAVSSLSATATAGATSAATTQAAASSSATSTAGTTGTTGAASSGLTGTWQIVPANSFVGYRVQEQLASIGANTAVGRTSSVTGSLTYDGSAITAVDVQADLSTLKSDDSRRDNALRRQALQTSQFPTASFKLTQPIALDHTPAEGEQISVTAHGQLTLHGVTRDVAIPLQGQLTGNQVVVVGSLPVQFADYQISPPNAFSVLSVDNHGEMELQLVFERAA